MPPAVAVAASGGRDSTALLHCTARAARALGVQVHALHVHHGLVEGADAWLAQVRAQCRRWDVQFHAARLDPSTARGSLEAWARRARYQALARMAREAGCTLVLLAHHRRDQAETLLLQALRGGGPAGLAAMPRLAEREGLAWARPWLALPREAIDAYLARHRLRWCEDASNDETRFARNRLRHAVWPALQRAFPDAEAQLHAAALRAAEAAACLREQVEADLAELVVEGAFVVERWRDLSAPRRAQALRAWLQAVAPGAPESLVRRLADELPRARAARWPAPGGEVALHDGRLSFIGSALSARDGQRVDRLDLSTPGAHAAAGWGGRFVVAPVASGGVPAAVLARATLHPRRGGEQFQHAPRATARSLKKQFQALRVPAWDRGGPLVYDGERLLFVPGLGIDARCRAAAGERQFTLRWEPQRP